MATSLIETIFKVLDVDQQRVEVLDAAEHHACHRLVVSAQGFDHFFAGCYRETAWRRVSQIKIVTIEEHARMPRTVKS